MVGEVATDRQVVKVRGTDRTKFLQDLITNDISRPDRPLSYAALLSPQGKYLFDFFVLNEADRLLIDIKQDCAADLVARLQMYRLRADVDIEPCDFPIAVGPGDAPSGGFADPRHPALGWRHYGATGSTAMTDQTPLRVEHVIPETGIELIRDDTYILEAGFERLNGVDFRKGCFVGQEIVARMKHKTSLRKGLVKVAVEGKADIGAAVMNAAGHPVGHIYSQAGGFGIAHLRFDRAAGALHAGSVTLVRV